MTKIQVDSNGKAIILNSKALEASEGGTFITKNIIQNGTYSASSDNADGYSSVTVNVSGGGGSTTGEFLVQVIDYDGTILKSERLDEGDIFTLPSQPSHTSLTFQSWSSPVTITNNTVTVTDSDITIGATYTTASGLSEFDITLTEVTGLSVTLNMNGTKNWGDGTSDTSTTHTYASTGDYTITCNGSTMTTSSSSGLFGQISSVKNYYIKDIRLGSSVTSIGSSAFQYCSSLTSITIPQGVASISSNVFQYCNALTSITIPSSVTSISSYAFRNCYSLTSITIPKGVTNIGNSTFSGCYTLRSITIPKGVTNKGNSTFSGCYTLRSITIPSGVTSISSYAFRSCYSLTSITIPSSITSIDNSAFVQCFSILEYDFSNHTAVPTLSNTSAFSSINGICKIKVPQSLYNDWIIATNWSTYANYIIGV